MTMIVISASTLGLDPQNADVRIFSRQAGNAGSLPIPGYGASTILVRFDNDGVWSGDLPPSDEYPQPQVYGLFNSATPLGYFQVTSSPMTLTYSQLQVTVSPSNVPVIISTSPPIAAEEGSLYWNPTDDSLHVRHGAAWIPVSSGTGGGGLSSSQIRALMKPFALAGGSSIAQGDLATTLSNKIESSAVAETLTVSGRSVSITSHNGTTESGDVDANTVKQDGTRVGSFNEISEFDFTNGIHVTATGTEATISGEIFEARLDAIEQFEGVLRSRTQLVINQRISISTANTAYSLRGTPLTLTGPDTEITVVVTQVAVPDGRVTFKKSDLQALTPVVRAGTELTDANSIQFTNTPDNDRYRIGIDSTGDWFGGSDTAGGVVTFWSIDRFDIDTTGQLQLSDEGDINLSLDSNNDLKGDIKADTVIPQDMKFDSGRSGNKYVKLNSAGTAFEGVDAPTGGGGGLDGSAVRTEIEATLQAGTNVALTPSGTGASRQITVSSTDTVRGAGDGLVLSGNDLAVNPGNGIEVNQDKVQVKLDGTTLDTSASGLKVMDRGIQAAQIANQTITSQQLANNAVEASELASNAVETAKILDAAVTEAKLAEAVKTKLNCGGQDPMREINELINDQEAAWRRNVIASWKSADLDDLTDRSFTVGGREWTFSDFDYRSGNVLAISLDTDAIPDTYQQLAKTGTKGGTAIALLQVWVINLNGNDLRS